MYEGVPFEQRTLGDLLEEFYLGVVSEVEALRSRIGDLDGEALDRLAELEDLLRPEVGERASLRGLSPEEAEETWRMRRSTGDPLVDYWEYRLSKDLPVNLDLHEAPPRSEWDDVTEAENGSSD